MESVGVALVGCGLIGRTHARCLRALASSGLKVHLAAAVDLDLNRAQQAAAEFGFASTARHADEAFQRDDVNAVWICTPTDVHGELVDRAVAARRAVFCEKPLAHNAHEAARMAAAVRAAKVPAQVGMVLRYSPLFLALHDRIARSYGSSGEPASACLIPGSSLRDAPSGGSDVRSADAEWGRPMAAIFRDDQGLPIHGLYGSDWRGEVEVAGGGTLIEHSIHDLDMLCWLFGPVRRVWCSAAYYAGHAQIEDVAHAVLHFESGLHATIISVWHGMPHRRSDRRLEIFFERARLETVGDFHGTLEIERTAEGVGDSNVEKVQIGQAPAVSGEAIPELSSDAYLLENRAFVLSLLEGREPSPSLEEALTAHRLVDALYDSASSGRAVDLAATTE